MTTETGFTDLDAARLHLEECERRAAGISATLEAKKAELSSLEGSGSEDYARLALLEGEVNALEGVTRRHRDAVEAARAALGVAEAEAARQAQIEQLVSMSDQMRELRDAQHADVREIAALLEPVAARMSERYLALYQLKEQRRALSAELGAGEYLSYRAWKEMDSTADAEKAAHAALLDEVRRAGGSPDALMLVCEPFAPQDVHSYDHGKVLSWNIDMLPRDTPELATAADIAAAAIRQKTWR